MISAVLGFKPKPRVGLLGGSFDPPHEGHVLITLEALKRLDLDEVWWLVSPQNPLKLRRASDLSDRVARARAMMQHPKVKITGIEAHLGSAFTHQTVRQLATRLPHVSFIWLMGADNLMQFHRWKEWRSIAHDASIAAFARPGFRAGALSAPGARALRSHMIRPCDARRLGGQNPPAWTFITMPLNKTSSSSLRANGGS